MSNRSLRQMSHFSPAMHAVGKAAGVVMLNKVALDPGHVYAIKTIGDMYARDGKVDIHVRH